jgi:flagellar assembly protein FliH
LPRIIKARDADTIPLRQWKPTPPQELPASTSEESGTLGLGSARQAAHPQSPSAAATRAAELEAARIREQALQEARAQAQQELQEQVAQLQRRAQELEVERQDFFDKVEPEVARLAVTIAEKILAKELETHPETVVDLVRAAMKRMREREALRVKLNPEDIPLVKAQREDLMMEVNGVKKLELIDDRRVARGGCVIESSNGILDARIKTQLDKIEQVLSEATDAESSPQA